MRALARDRERPRGQAGVRRPRAGAPDRRHRARPLRGRRQPHLPVPRARRHRRHLRAHARLGPADEGDGPPLQGGDLDGARALNEEMAPAFDLLRIATNPIPIKAALNLLGHEVGGYRLPWWSRPTRSSSRSRLPRPCRRPRAGVRVAATRLPDGRLPDHPARRPRRGREEHDRLRGGGLDRDRRRRARVPARRASRRRPRSCRTSRTSVERASMIRGVVLTHGHEDHVGACRTSCARCTFRVVAATRLTLGLVKSKLDEHGLLREAELREVAPGDEPFQLGPFAIEFVRMAHSIPDAAAVVLERRAASSSTRATTSSTTRPSTGSAPTSASSRDRQPRRRPRARGLDERGAAGRHAVGARRRRGVPPDLPVAQGQDPRRVVRVERPPDAAGGRRRHRLRPQGRVRRPLDAQELEHRAQPRLHGRARTT